MVLKIELARVVLLDPILKYQPPTRLKFANPVYIGYFNAQLQDLKKHILKTSDVDRWRFYYLPTFYLFK